MPFPNSIAQITVAHVRANLRDQRDDDTLPWQALDHPIRLRGVVQFLYYNDIRGFLSFLFLLIGIVNIHA